jgi:hypothetical protein
MLTGGISIPKLEAFAKHRYLLFSYLLTTQRKPILINILYISLNTHFGSKFGLVFAL